MEKNDWLSSLYSYNGIPSQNFFSVSIPKLNIKPVSVFDVNLIKEIPKIPDELKVEINYPTQLGNKQNTTLNKAASGSIRAATDFTSDYLSNQVFGNDTEFGRNLGAIFSSGVSSAGDTLSLNILKGNALFEGLGQNVGASVAGTTAGVAGNLIGKGINSLGGNSMLSRGIGQGVATGIGMIGGSALSNIIKGKQAFEGINNSIKAIKGLNALNKSYKAAGMSKDAIKLAKESGEAQDIIKAGKMGYANLAGMAGQIVGTGLQAAFGPSKEYGGKYGNITRNMDTAYDLVLTAAGFIPGYGTAISGLMAMNKGLSNVFGSTDGMTRQDAILGSAFMPAPVKWLNMAGASTTGSFNNLSWQNTERANSFMGNAFGNLNDRFDKAREEAGKTYGTFSQGAKDKALNNLNFANRAWELIMSMADLNEILNIRSLYMSSINNLRYAQEIGGAWLHIYRGKQGMKIFNNATNHNIGQRLLSGAALIDNKQMILCNVPD